MHFTPTVFVCGTNFGLLALLKKQTNEAYMTTILSLYLCAPLSTSDQGEIFTKFRIIIMTSETSTDLEPFSCCT